MRARKPFRPGCVPAMRRRCASASSGSGSTTRKSLSHLTLGFLRAAQAPPSRHATASYHITSGVSDWVQTGGGSGSPGLRTTSVWCSRTLRRTPIIEHRAADMCGRAGLPGHMFATVGVGGSKLDPVGYL